MSKKHPTRLILSFIGNTDIKYIEPDGQNISPILRLLSGITDLRPAVKPEDTHLVLFDDIPEDGKRRDFVEKLKPMLPDLGLEGLTVERVELLLPDGPNDLETLYDRVWRQFGDKHGKKARDHDQVFFHISSGTFAMQMTLALAATCLPLKTTTRIFQTSQHRDGSLNELRLPYELAALDIRGGTRTAKPARLSATARRSLIEHTVVEDSRVATAYQMLFNSATTPHDAPRVLVTGPIGSGKWHACRQFSVWRKQPEVVIPGPEALPDAGNIAENATILVFRIDAWPEPMLARLSQLTALRQDLAVAASLRTDTGSEIIQDTVLREGIRGSVTVSLPHAETRVDRVSLAKAFAIRSGLLAGKVEERLKADLMRADLHRGLHDLESRMKSAASRSEERHVGAQSYRVTRDSSMARDVLDRSLQTISDLRFDPSHAGLYDILEDIEKAVVALARAAGRTQGETAEFLGCTNQQDVSKIEQRAYRTAHDAGADAGDA